MYTYHKAENCRATFWQSALCRIWHSSQNTVLKRSSGKGWYFKSVHSRPQNMLYVPSCLNLQRLAQDCMRAGWRDPLFSSTRAVASLSISTAVLGHSCVTPSVMPVKDGTAPRVGVGLMGTGTAGMLWVPGWWWYSPLTAILKGGYSDGTGSDSMPTCGHTELTMLPSWVGTGYPRWCMTEAMGNPLAITPL